MEVLVLITSVCDIIIKIASREARRLNEPCPLQVHTVLCDLRDCPLVRQRALQGFCKSIGTIPRPWPQFGKSDCSAQVGFTTCINLSAPNVPLP